ncbi:MAG: hypothetical protein QXX01_03085 [Candidatus Aenigmatarchaeota archaeon]
MLGKKSCCKSEIKQEKMKIYKTAGKKGVKGAKKEAKDIKIGRFD